MSSRPSGRELSARDADSSPPQILCHHKEERKGGRADLEVGAPESTPTLAKQKVGFSGSESPKRRQQPRAGGFRPRLATKSG